MERRGLPADSRVYFKWLDVLGPREGRDDFFHDGDLITLSINGLDSGCGLQGVGRVHDHDPIAVPQQGDLLLEFVLPRLRRLHAGDG